MTRAGAAAEQLAAASCPHLVRPCAHHLQETGGGGLAAAEDAEAKVVAKDATVAMERAGTAETIAMMIETSM